MPNVPRVPGVPSLSSFAAGPIDLLVADAALIILSFLRPVWGIFLDGAPALDVNSVLRFDFRKDSSIPDYQVEQGGFQSYNKVQLPFDVRLRVVSGPDVSDRQEIIAQLEVLQNSTELYDVVTPEKVYADVNCVHADYNRTAASSLGMIIADVWFTEVRVGATTKFSNTQQPQEAGRQNAGNVQPQTPPAGLFAPNLSFL